MPTPRALVLLALAGLLYFLANQTQVGWLYLISNGMAGLLVVDFFYGWRGVRAIEGSREFGSPPTGAASDLLAEPALLHEDDEVEIRLRLANRGRRRLFAIGGQEGCPLAPPGDQLLPLFLPTLGGGEETRLSYRVQCARRGLHCFAPLTLHSGGAFGLFRWHHRLEIPTEILVHPSYHPIRHLPLLSRHAQVGRQGMRTGTGQEVVGVREYRPGDPSRSVHWRSSARAGQLIVKEFAEEEEPALTVVLDLHRDSNIGEGKEGSFEVAVRIAASLGYYATSKQIPFHLVGASPRWRPPRMALGWWSILNYLARVENDGSEPLAALLPSLVGRPLVVVLVSHPDERTARALATLGRRGCRVLALFITPDGSPPPAAMTAEMDGIEVIGVGPRDWAAILSGEPPRATGSPPTGRTAQ